MGNSAGLFCRVTADAGQVDLTTMQRWPQDVIYSNLQFYCNCNVATELLLKTKKKLEQEAQGSEWRVTQKMSKRAAKIVIVVRSPVGVSIIC